MVSNLFNLILWYRWPWRVAIIALSFLGALLGVLGPYFQKHFIDTLLQVPSSIFFGFETQLSPPVLIVLAFCCLLLTQTLNLLTSYLGMREAIILQKILSEKIYEKTLSLRPDSQSGRTVGEIVAIYATDVMGATILIEQSLPAGAATLFPLILAPLGLYWLFKIPLVEIILVMGTVVGINTFLAFRQSTFFMRFKQLAAERLGLVNEWILNIKALKILGWLEAYEDKIQALRIKETQNRISMVTNGQTMNSISSTVTFIINAVAIYLLVHLRKGQLTPGEILGLLWILGIFLTRPFRQLPWFFTFGFDGWTSLKRIAQFLSLKNQGHDWQQGLKANEMKLETRGPAIEVNNLSLHIGSEKLLDKISFSVHPQEFVAIVGEVGSGKTMLLLSLIGETGAQFDSYKINGQEMLAASHNELCKHFAFVPQEGFVISASLRENIALDYDVGNKGDSRIFRCLENAQFFLDQEAFPDQLDTEIGERGVNLSGGQKQRVSLARAAFYDCPVILMDDSLSALDVNTERKLLHSLIKGSWAEKTRILTTHRFSVLKEVDRIIFLEAGTIIGQGTLEDLIESSGKFRKFIESLKIETGHEKDC